MVTFFLAEMSDKTQMIAIAHLRPNGHTLGRDDCRCSHGFIYRACNKMGSRESDASHCSDRLHDIGSLKAHGAFVYGLVGNRIRQMVGIWSAAQIDVKISLRS